MAHWVQKAQVTEYLEEIQYKQHGLQVKVGSPREDPRITPYKPTVSLLAGSQIRPAQVWEMKRDAYSTHKQTIMLAWVLSHTSDQTADHPSFCCAGVLWSELLVHTTEKPGLRVGWGMRNQAELRGHPCRHCRCLLHGRPAGWTYM